MLTIKVVRKSERIDCNLNILQFIILNKVLLAKAKKSSQTPKMKITKMIFLLKRDRSPPAQVMERFGQAPTITHVFQLPIFQFALLSKK